MGQSQSQSQSHTAMRPSPTALMIMLVPVLSQDQRDPITALSEAIPVTPGEDYPILSIAPETSFQCDGYIEGYYADTEAECQVFHICGNQGDTSLVKYDFLCPNGTLFNQQYFICDWWFNVDCSLAETFYSLNEDVAAAAAAATAASLGRAGDDSEALPSYSAASLAGSGVLPKRKGRN